MKSKKPALAEVDGTIPGRAVVIFVHDFSGNAVPSQQIFDESPTCEDPIETARTFGESFYDDPYWDDYVISYNHRAHYLQWKRRMESLIGEDGEYAPQDFINVK